MEKVGLITIHETLNYGSLAQAFSTYKALESIGVDVELVDYKCDKIWERERLKNLFESHSITAIFEWLIVRNANRRKWNNYQDFVHKNMRLSVRVDKYGIEKLNERYDTFVVGSDIVWGMDITGHDFNYMLQFVKDNKRKLAFSSSVGEKWSDEDSEQIKILLSRFEQISTREQLAAEWLGKLINKNIYTTCDPTMLFNADFWTTYSRKENVPENRYVLVYMRDKNKKNIKDAVNYGKKYNIPVYFIKFGIPELIRGIKLIMPETFYDWIALFQNAECVFTASYHGLLFSLYFNTPVFYYNRGNKSRMISLCTELEILHREGLDVNIERDIPINWDFVNQKIEEKRKFSIDVLKSFFNENH
ncbi:MAG: polysaccharide pyruvyl transferase family protein [Bacteroidales bacterium]|nr:polysaccharide pyruvyl transferase family protein [Bacteroidales bacterium]MCM1146228.1 polysaccharide pyruvyl transferase family protein [Bacteroidales bacterium]MCM1205334.1 polysaccharide pyruvyl transferase family protein [Bacillota bacterium]MCM1509579.1 polysaccharide pyruvyl transferase family protein [Clostridium sp.]